MNALGELAMPPKLRRVPRIARPRLGFLGLGWIGRARLDALAGADLADVTAIADTDPARLRELEARDGCVGCATLDELLEHDLDGIVIATPGGMHAAQAIHALERGCAVFCQKPLSRNADEARRIVATARERDVLLGVDLNYRHVAGVAAMRDLVALGELGDIHAIDLVFHNAYGPDKAWFYDVAQSGGGCVMDLGVHLVDLAGWVSGERAADQVDARLSHQGHALHAPIEVAEDYASVQYRLGGHIDVRLACSWRSPAGTDARIEASFFGSRGGAALRNVDGSFYDFRVDRHDGTRRIPLASPPDAWGGRALIDWTRKLAAGGRFDDDALALIDVAQTLDDIYAR